MAVVFDYSAYLQNSEQLVKGSYPEWNSETFSNPNNQVFFWGLLNPGHAGTATVIEYAIYIEWKGENAAVLSYTWQIKPSGGAWVTLTGATGTVTAPVGLQIVSYDTGIHTTSTLMPAEIQVIGTDADADWSIDTIGGATYFITIRAYGTV